MRHQLKKMVTPAGRRKAVVHLMELHQVGQRRACDVLQVRCDIGRAVAMTLIYEMRSSGCPCGHDYLSGDIGGKLGWELSREESDVTVDFAMEEMVKLVGSDARKHFIKGFRTDWANDQNTLGAYAAVQPGHASVRDILEAPVAGRLFFAGEAMGRGHSALVSGAYKSGKRAARKLCKVV